VVLDQRGQHETRNRHRISESVGAPTGHDDQVVDVEVRHRGLGLHRQSLRGADDRAVRHVTQLVARAVEDLRRSG
jgi:hypothetical protein